MSKGRITTTTAKGSLKKEKLKKWKQKVKGREKRKSPLLQKTIIIS
jgi:hypothetical protein